MTRDEWLAAGPAGWQSLVLELDAELKQRWPDYSILQVKEKFGTLRFYATPGVPAPDFSHSAAGTATRNQRHADNPRAFQDVIDGYEAKSAQVCQVCGQPGKLGSRGHWLSTLCSVCAPDGWTAHDAECGHVSIEEGTCVECGRERLARLEHSAVLLVNTHAAGACLGERCTIHNRSEHAMRSFPQVWRSDRMLMERVCPHGVGHPDPDDIRLTGPHGDVEAVHGCDGCCMGVLGE